MRKLLLAGAFIMGAACFSVEAQVNTVEFGKNRVQYQKFKWRYYQTTNFNTYFSQDGLGLGKYVTQIAETELPSIEEFVEYGMQRRINIVVFNSFDEMQQSNIGLDIDWQNTGGVTKFVNNKMLVYFDGNHDNLRKQIRQGLSKVLVQNILFGDDLGEFATNQALLDLPQWLTDGYIEYAAEPWSPTLDDDLRSVMLSAEYSRFYQFAFEKPMLAGHSFWKYIADKYGKNKVTYFFYLSRIYRNLNSASQKLAGKKFKDLLKDFMLEVPQQYYKDIRGRRNAPKGQLGVSEVIGKKDFMRFNANPNPRSFTYVVVEYKQGIYSVVLNENFVNRKVLLKYGTRSREDEKNPNYPIIAWDGKGTRIAVVYYQEGKLKLFVYDAVNRVKVVKQELPMFNQVQDVKYMLDNNTLLLSAVRSGQTDIYTYKIDRQSYEQITNDVYDDLDPSFVAFPNKTGILYSSNRPSAMAASTEDSLPAPHFNIFLIDNWNKSEFKQISQLTRVNYGNARFPSQYNTSHFTFVSDENGVNNRYAGFFTTERAGLDTLIFIGDEVLRNPPLQEVDSVLKEWEKTDIDSVGFVSITNDSSYIFPLTNYQSSLLETRTAGDNQQVSEVVKLGNVKLLYRLKVDENALRRRNVIARPTEYMKQVLDEQRAARNRQAKIGNTDAGDKPKQNDFFQSEFDNEKRDSITADGEVIEADLPADPLLRKAKLYEYRPPKFFVDYAVTGFNNTVFPVNKFQPYTGGGPVQLSNGGDFNGMIRAATSDLMEDLKFTGGFRIAPNLRDNDVLFSFMNLKKRLDWGFIYYRKSLEGVDRLMIDNAPVNLPSKQFANYYLAQIRYALDRVRSFRAVAGPRFDKAVPTSAGVLVVGSDILKAEEKKTTYGQVSMEYVHDNTLNPASNIWKGLRYKIFVDWFTQLSDAASTDGKFIFNAGFDARHYLPIYRNAIWAVRAAGDFSFGEQKVVYYLGGVDNWFSPKFNNQTPVTQSYSYQSLALNMRGFDQNIANGNNAIVINSEVRLPVFTTLFNKPINNAFLRNFQLVQFLDLGTAWAGGLGEIRRPENIVQDPNDPNSPYTVRYRAGGLGPLAGGYGFGARSTLLGYFIRVDAAWEMNGVFRGKPKWYFAMGFDF